MIKPVVQSVVRPAVNPVQGGGGVSWSSYWTTRYISGLTIVVDSDTQFTLNWTNNGTQD
jgi:hypothetical protein